MHSILKLKNSVSIYNIYKVINNYKKSTITHCYHMYIHMDNLTSDLGLTYY